MDLDTIRAIAEFMVLKHGPEASIHAAMHADAKLDAGDFDGQRIWIRVLDAIKESHARSPREGDH